MIYDTIKDVAEKQSVSIRKIETDLGFSNGTIRAWSTSQSLPLVKIKRVAQYLKVDPYTLLLVGIDMDKVKIN